MKNNKIPHCVGTVRKFNRKIVERQKDTLTHIYIIRSLPWIGPDTSIKKMAGENNLTGPKIK